MLGVTHHSACRMPSPPSRIAPPTQTYTADVKPKPQTSVNSPGHGKALCLCGPTFSALSWGPRSFNQLVVHCVIEISSVEPAAASAVSSVENLCAKHYSPNTASSTSATVTSSINTVITPTPAFTVCPACFVPA
jgi:hypothetical protein